LVQRGAIFKTVWKLIFSYILKEADYVERCGLLCRTTIMNHFGLIFIYFLGLSNAKIVNDTPQRLSI